MCNDYRLEVDVSQIADDFDGIKIRLETPEGIPNIQPRADIKITDVAPIVMSSKRGAGLLVQRRWSWPGQGGRPVYNFRSEGREFKEHRCLILVDGFYEFTKPEDPKQKRKDKWLFTKRDERLFCIAGIWREPPEVGPAFTMLTMEPGPDVAPYHSRQVVVLERDCWSDWLDTDVPAHMSYVRFQPVVCRSRKSAKQNSLACYSSETKAELTTTFYPFPAAFSHAEIRHSFR